MAEPAPRFSSPVQPGQGWPGDPATVDTPVAADPAGVAELAASADGLGAVDAQVSVCRACPRLVGWREQVAHDKRAAFADQPYWGRPVPGFGPADARLLVVGLAPAAHGANRTGRNFTGDRSGDWLYAALFRCGLANQPDSVAADDGLELADTRVVATVRCAPPGNKPTTGERDTCRPWLRREFALLPQVRAMLALGSFGWDACLGIARDAGFALPRPRPRFAHAATVELSHCDGRRMTLVASFHPSQQNTFTGRLTESMLDAAITAAIEAARD